MPSRCRRPVPAPARALARGAVAALLALAVTSSAPALAGPPAHGGAEAAPEPAVSSASSGPVSVSTRAGAILERATRFRGAIPPEDAGRAVLLERLDPMTGQWSPIARATARDDGRFTARWKTDRAGRHEVRARVEPGAATASGAAPQVAVTVYKGARATWYGPGFYGRRTACGQKMSRSLMGVAHKKLPCGTEVTVFFAGRTVTVPVVDRGPYSRGVWWDLTAATARAVGFDGRAVVGVAPQAPSK